MDLPAITATRVQLPKRGDPASTQTEGSTRSPCQPTRGREKTVVFKKISKIQPQLTRFKIPSSLPEFDPTTHRNRNQLPTHET